MKLGKDAELEMAVYVLFRQKREEGIPITRAIVQAKALELHTRLHVSQDDGVDEIPAQVTVSAGWLWRFCWHHNIRQLALQGEKLSADEPPAASFIPEFQKFVEDNNYSLDQVFNCDESGLYYKLLPQNSLVKSSEKSASGRKTQEERVTISACSNTSGSIKLPLVLIVSAKKSWCFKNVACASHPVSYYNQQNVWVTAALFTNWFHQTFVPTVQAKLVDLGLEPKAAPDRQSLCSSWWEGIHRKWWESSRQVSSSTTLIQPMDQGRHRKILEELVLQEDSGKSVVDFLKGIDMLKVVDLISTSWDEIEPITFCRPWWKIIPQKDDAQDDNTHSQCSYCCWIPAVFFLVWM